MPINLSKGQKVDLTKGNPIKLIFEFFCGCKNTKTIKTSKMW